jgi:hypothetical protein
MSFDIVGKIEETETIAAGGLIRDVMRLQKQFGADRWRKLKGVAMVKLQSGSIRKAEPNKRAHPPQVLHVGSASAWQAAGLASVENNLTVSAREK